MIFVVLFTFIAGCLFLGFNVRPLKSKSFEITTGNKDPQRPMKWYEDRIREQLKDMRFERVSVEQGVERYRPRHLHKIYEPEVILEITPYTITIVASRLVIRLISTYVEIDETN